MSRPEHSVSQIRASYCRKTLFKLKESGEIPEAGDIRIEHIIPLSALCSILFTSNALAGKFHELVRQHGDTFTDEEISAILSTYVKDPDDMLNFVILLQHAIEHYNTKSYEEISVKKDRKEVKLETLLVTRESDSIRFSFQEGYSLFTIAELAFLLHIVPTPKEFDSKEVLYTMLCRKITEGTSYEILEALDVPKTHPRADQYVQYIRDQAQILFSLYTPAQVHKEAES